MSLFGSKTFDWPSANKRGNVVWHLPRNIRLNDNIVVREDEIAVFYRDGKALGYIDRPDRYALTSINAPIVGPIVKALSGVEQRAEVYYIQKRPFDGKFGSKQPYQFRDKEFDVVSLRLHGEFRYKVALPENFINQFVGTLSLTSANQVEERIKEQVVVVTYDALGEMKNAGLGVLDLAANLEEIEQAILAKSLTHFELYGLEIQKISGLNISLPDEVQEAVDARAAMAITGTDFIRYQTGTAMREAAANPAGGGAGAGVGVGAGIGMGVSMMDEMRRRVEAPGAPCVNCGRPLAQGSKFCNVCGADQTKKPPEGGACPRCGKAVDGDAKFCPHCGASLAPGVCANCGAALSPGAKFCAECGTPVGQADGGE
ncbi:MAG: SPFH domain-containing protein [Thermoplasmata archaeon]